MAEEQVLMAGGLVASSKVPPVHLIPTAAIVALAERFQQGVERKGDKAWNATSPNQVVLDDRAFAIERLSHVILHAMQLRDKLAAGNIAEIIHGDDDSGAILWSGAFLTCVVDRMRKNNEGAET
jgi:hypothetical protein